MEIEVALAGHSSNEQHRPGEPNIISKSADRQNTPSGKKIWKKSKLAYNISKSRRMFYSCLKSNKMNGFAIILFISLAVVVGVLSVGFGSRKKSETCQGTFKRTMKSSLISGSQPRGVTVGDVNNDYQMDIIVANSGTNTIGIFLSKGNGAFEKQQTYFTGSESCPYWAAVSNFNDDNYVDVAVANYATNNIGIFLGNGNGIFGDHKIISLDSSRPVFITVGDFNEDQQMDIIAASNGTDSISILLGYGDGSFHDQTNYSTGYDSAPSSLAVGDFNKDNHSDIAVANYGTNNIGIFFGDGNGTFTRHKIYTTTPNSNPSSIVVGDFNNDNQLDIAVTDNGIGNLGIFLGQDNGTFAAQVTYSTGSNSYPQHITANHFNKDNYLDIAITDSKNNQLYVFPGYGNGSFAPVSTYDGIYRSNPYGIAAIDLNNNNRSDIVIANYGANNVLVLIDYFIEPSVRITNYISQPSSPVGPVAVTDLNNDHILDIICAVGQNISTLTGLGNGTFGKRATHSIDIGSPAQYICVGDLNNDNRMDIVSANIEADSIGIFLGRGDGTFLNMTTYSTGNGSSPRWVALGDINKDNRLDIVSANHGTATNTCTGTGRVTGTISIFLGNGNGTFAIIMNSSIDIFGGTPTAVGIEDINNDNYLDIVIVCDDNHYLLIYLGNGDTNFIFWKAYYRGEHILPYSIAFADFNSDTHRDIVVANYGTNDVSVFLGYGNGTFAEPTAYSTGNDSQPLFAIVADFNNDNISDIAASNFGTNEIVILYGDGNGNFPIATIDSTGNNSKPFGITTADFDNNKQLDIVVGLWGTGNLAVLSKYHAAEFVNNTIYSTGSVPQPFSVAISDFNNDNRSDIVVANSGTDNLGILLGSNNGMFDIDMMYLIGTDADPQYVITCDINKDNYIDIVSANSISDSISVIMGYGNGTFAEKMRYSTGYGSHPFAVASGDFNNDTLLDLVIANEGTNSIGILLAYNYTTFQSQVTVSNNDGLGPVAVIISDFNNDSYLDIAAIFDTTNNIGILLGCGNGNFTSMMLYSTGNDSQPYDIAVGDFNKDNQLDIVVANPGTYNVGILLGYGNGSFAAIITHSTGTDSCPVAVAVGDINNDNQLDIIVANYVSNNVGVLIGYGNGSFSIQKTYPTRESSIPNTVTVIDIDIDGQLDIVASNLGTNNVGIFFGYGNGSFQNQLEYPTGCLTSPFDIGVGDFNGDNRLDIAIPLGNSINVGILLGNGNRTFADIVTYSTGAGSRPRSVRVHDFNNDSHLDIAVANYGSNNIVVLFGFGDGTFLLGTAYSTGTGSQPVALDVGDINKDGRLDIAVANYPANNIGVFFGYGNERFADPQAYPTGDESQPHSVAIGDLNNDGWSDIVTANYGTDNVGILLGRKNGIFDGIITYSTGTGSTPYSVVVADFNNDTRLDILVSNSEIDGITILNGYGNGTFEIGATHSTGARSEPYTVAIGDFNNDKIWDIAVADYGTNSISLLYGYGNGTFGNNTSHAFGYDYDPSSIAVKDLDHNNWTDIVIACVGTDHVETLIKMC